MIQLGSPLHQSALLLHSMTGRDRDWLLGRLEQAQRERLQALLDELTSLGIPADEKLLKQYLGTEQENTADGIDEAWSIPVFDHVSEDSGIEKLCLAGAEQLAATLKTEPDLLIARLLSVHPWPWRDDVLARLGPVKGRSVGVQVDALLQKRGSDGRRLTGEHTAMAKMLVSLVLARLELREASKMQADVSPHQRYQIDTGKTTPWLRSFEGVMGRWLKPRHR